MHGMRAFNPVFHSRLFCSTHCPEKIKSKHMLQNRKTLFERAGLCLFAF